VIDEREPDARDLLALEDRLDALAQLGDRPVATMRIPVAVGIGLSA
jgi:hypothetical protein